MDNTLLSDVEARAERRRTRTRDAMWQELVRHSWDAAYATEEPATRRRWLERAHRLLRTDPSIMLGLAAARMATGDIEGALTLFRAVAAVASHAPALLGQASCAHLLGLPDEAEAATARALRSGALTPELAAVAALVAPAGWCGFTTGGVLHAGPRRPDLVRCDGVVLEPSWSGGAAALPGGWQRFRRIEVEFDGRPALGSPLPVAVFAAVEGFVEAVAGGVRGWAWSPADPTSAVTVQATGALGRQDLQAAEPLDPPPPLTRPRAFHLNPADVLRLGPPLAFHGLDGRPLLGSPLDPAIESRAASDPAQAACFAPVWADVRGPAARYPTVRPPVDVVIPVYRGLTETMACLQTVLATVRRPGRVIVVDDASPEPELSAALDALARRRRIRLIRLPQNRGFPGAANAGMAAAAGRDVVLLNSDTLVPPGWLERLRAAAYAAPDIGTVTPLSNDATINSYPGLSGGNPVPDRDRTEALDLLAQEANAGLVVDIPVGVGFCLYLRRDCLEATGPLREDLFAQGYGEENDLCLRARHRGYRNVAAPGVFVAHVGAASFGPARAHLVRRNGAILERLHPGYDALVARHVAADPLAAARFRIDALRWAEGRRREGAAVLVTHGGGGGVERVVQERCRAIRASGRRAIVLRPARRADGTAACRLEDAGADTPNLVFAMPAGLAELAAFLRPDRVRTVELHHLLGHHHAIAGLAARLRAEAVSVVHDYARFCPRIALVSTNRLYCGEPDVAGCEACIADLGSLLEDDPPVRTLIARSAAELAGADRIIAPSADAASRIGRHFPGVAAAAEAWEDDRELPPRVAVPRRAVLRVAVVGAIGTEKGFDVLLGCVRDAAARGLRLEFVVVGFTADDRRLMDAGPAFVTGEYREQDAVALVREQAAQLGFIPSVWPETWCFALSRLWQAGLDAVAFDLGAPAERIRRSGRGTVLPLGLGARGINDALLRLAPPLPASQCPPQPLQDSRTHHV